MATSESMADLRPVSSNDDDDEKEELRMPTPPQDWAFNDLLIAIANAMTTEDFKEAKARFKGDDGLTRRLLEAISTPLELFDSLQKHLFLGRNNLLFLQAMLYKLGRMDLFDRAIDYAQSTGDVIFFSSPPQEPTNGYRYVQFHIEGTDFRKYKRSSLEATRMTAAKLMFVPPEFVIIAGIEPSSSLLITFMIPTRFIKYLEAAIKKRTTAKELTNLGVDMVRLNDTAINLHGIEGADVIETDEQIKLKTVYEQLKTTKERLEDQEIECIELRRQLELKESRQIDVSDQMKAMFINWLYATHLKQTVPQLSKQSAFVFFKFALNQAKKLKYSKDVIDMLLDAQSYVLSARVKDNQDIRFHALLVEIQALKSQVFQLQIVIARFEIWNVFDSEELQRRITESLRSTVLGNLVIVAQEVQLSPFAFQILKELSSMLNAEEKRRLLNAYTWPEEDELTKHMKKEDSVLLVVILAKELQTTGVQVPFDQFVLQKLADVKRVDLQEMFKQMWSNKTDYTYTPPAEGTSTTHQARSGKHQAKSSKHQHSKFSKGHQNKSATPPPPPKKNLDEQVELVLKKVESIEGMIQEARTYKSSFGTDAFQQNLLSQEFKSDPRNLFGRYGTPINTKLQ